ncbi:MAG: HlyD family secretion protein [Rhodothermales bacterium]
MEAPSTTTPAPVESTEYNATSSPGRKAPLRRMVWVVIALAGAVAGLGWGYQKWHYAVRHVSTDDAQIEGHIVPVLAKVGGYVKAVNVQNNQEVDRDAPLVVLDDVELQTTLAGATAALAEAEIVAHGRSQTDVVRVQRQSEALEAQIAAARANAERADRDLERYKALAAEQMVSQLQLDAASAAATSAHATVRALEQQEAASQAEIASAESSVRLAGARLAVAQARRDAAALELEYAHVTAPARGIVAKKSVEVGQLLQPGQPLMAIVSDTDVWVTAHFKETDLAQLTPGQSVDIELDAYPECTARGEIESISPATGATFALLPPDNATGNYTKVVQRVSTRIRIVDGCGPAQPLRPGLSAVVHVQTAE